MPAIRSLIRLAWIPLLAIAPLAQADVPFIDIFQSVSFDQSDGVSTPTPYLYAMGARLFTTSAGDVTSATLTDPSANAYTMSTNIGNGVGYFDYSAPNLAALQAAYPVGDYTFAVDAGSDASLIGKSATMSLPNGNDYYADTVPMLDAASWNALQNAQAGQAVNIAWNNYGSVPAASFTLIYFNVYDSTLGSTVFDGTMNGSDKDAYRSDTIPGAVFIAGHDYYFSLFFDPRVQGAPVSVDPAFGSTSAVAGFDYVTTGSFSVAAVPEPTTILVAGAGFLALLRRRR